MAMKNEAKGEVTGMKQNQILSADYMFKDTIEML